VAPDPRRNEPTYVREEAQAGAPLTYALLLVGAFFASFGIVALALHGPAAIRERGKFRPSASASALASARARDAGTPVAAKLAPPPSPSPSPTTSTSTGAPRNYNVLLLTIDTLRADLGFAGYPRPVTPHLDALAAHGVVFEQAYSTASYTPKAMGPLMIGRYATETARNSEHYTTFFPSNTFVAERAHAAGVRTFGGVCHRYFLWKKGFQEGFDIYDMSAAWPEPRDEDTRVTSDRLSDAALRLLARPENVGTKRFFAWFHYVDPHTPYVPHPGAPAFASMPPPKTPAARAAYDGEVWFTDGQVGRVIDYVRSQPWGKDTAIIVTADHGEAFGEKNHFRHGRELWQPLVHVPLIIDLPDGTSKRIPVKRSHIDVVPTILELLGVPVAPGTLRGKSLLIDVRANDPAQLEERDIFIDMPKGPYNEARRAIITGPTPGIKLIQFPSSHFEAYDLAADPAEAHLLSKGDERFQTAKAAFDKMVGTLEEVPASP
jgi:arylsulfatase A-like enzyme